MGLELIPLSLVRINEELIARESRKVENRD
jgi:hypothetical protein